MSPRGVYDFPLVVVVSLSVVVVVGVVPVRVACVLPILLLPLSLLLGRV